jgi:phosphatidylglycerophosphatase A
MKHRFTRFIREMIATGFYTGYIPFMPGTFGTLIGVIIYIFLSRFDIFYYILVILLIVVAVFVSDYAEKKIFKKKDAQYIVIDEVVGFLIAMVSFQFDFTLESVRFIVIGFVLFRAFDIWKPYPINKVQELEGGLGIVIDDLLAGVFTNLFLQFLRFNGSFFGF